VHISTGTGKYRLDGFLGFQKKEPTESLDWAINSSQTMIHADHDKDNKSMMTMMTLTTFNNRQLSSLYALHHHTSTINMNANNLNLPA
jgi:hypothetical protein